MHRALQSLHAPLGQLLLAALVMLALRPCPVSAQSRTETIFDHVRLVGYTQLDRAGSFGVEAGDVVEITYTDAPGPGGPPTSLLISLDNGWSDRIDGPGTRTHSFTADAHRTLRIEGRLVGWDPGDYGEFTVRRTRPVHLNAIADGLTIRSAQDEALVLSYRLTGNTTNATSQLSLQVLWVTKNNVEVPIVSSSIPAPHDDAQHQFLLPKPVYLGKRPLDPVRIVARLGLDGSVQETSRSDNETSYALPDFYLLGADWSPSGDLVVHYGGSRGSLDPSVPVTIQVRPWFGLYFNLPDAGAIRTEDLTQQTGVLIGVTGTVWDNLVEDAGPLMLSRPARTTSGFYDLSVPAAQLASSYVATKAWDHMDCVSHVLVSIDMEQSLADHGRILELSERNNGLLVRVGSVSPELQEAPMAESSQQRVALWMRDNRAPILQAARHDHLDPRAIAGAIAWEALENNKCGAERKWTRGFGPGKIHLATALEAEHYGTIRSRGRDDTSRALRTTPGSIRYVSAIMNAYATEAQKSGFDLRTRPDILALLFNGSGCGDIAQTVQRGCFAQDKAAGLSPSLPAQHDGSMGWWVHDHLDLLGRWLSGKR